MCIFGRKKIKDLEARLDAANQVIADRGFTIRSMASHIEGMKNDVAKLCETIRVRDEQIALLESKIRVYYRDEKGRFISKPVK